MHLLPELIPKSIFSTSSVSCRSANSTAASLIFFVEKEQPLFILNAPSKLRIPSLMLPGQSITPCVSLSAKINHRLAEASTKRPSSALNSLKLHSFLILSTDPTAYAVRQLGSSILLLGPVPAQMNLPNPSLHWDSEAYSDSNLSYLRITPLTVGVTVAFPLFVGKRCYRHQMSLLSPVNEREHQCC